MAHSHLSSKIKNDDIKVIESDYGVLSYNLLAYVTYVLQFNSKRDYDEFMKELYQIADNNGLLKTFYILSKKEI